MDGEGSSFGLGGEGGLPKTLDEAVNLKDFRRQIESRYVNHVLNLADGSVTKAAKVLGVDRSHLHQKLKDLGLV